MHRSSCFRLRSSTGPNVLMLMEFPPFIVSAGANETAPDRSDYESLRRKKKAIRRQRFIGCSCRWIGAITRPSSSRVSAANSSPTPPLLSGSISGVVARDLVDLADLAPVGGVCLPAGTDHEP